MISIIILSILTITSVNASENITDTDVNNYEDNLVSNIDNEPNITVPSKIGEESENEITIDADKEYIKTFDDVQKAIDDAKENDTIELNGTYYGNGRQISLEKSLTFQGKENATFDAQKLSRIFLITSSDVVFKNINFINGNFNDTTYYYDGGIIKAESEGTMKFINCKFINNTVLGNGGVIFSSGMKTSIVNSTFTNNTATSSGGAIFSSIADISIDNSTFISNSASSGGAIEASMTSVSIINSKFIANNASSGAAIWSDGFIFVNNTSFIKNRASDNGGAIKIDSGLEVIDSTFIENTADTGGAICLSCSEFGPNLSLINSTFLKNSAKDTGGALYLSFSVYREHQEAMPDGHANLKGNSFKNNTAEMAGAIFIHGNMNVSDSIFENNFADLIGSIHITSGTVNISECSFKNNSKRNIHLINPGKLIIGDAIYTTETILDNEIPTIKVNVDKIDTFYNSGKLLTVKLTDFKSKKPISGYVSLKVGKKIYELKTNAKGIATFKASLLNAGKYSVTVTHKNGSKYLAIADTFSSINVKKASTTVKAPKVSNKYKKSKYFKFTVKSNKKVVKNLKVKVKVYTGKKYKTYTIKTDKKGVAKLNTKSLKIGKHKVVVSSGNNNYKVSTKSQITIKR